jgi:hypothetical protein
MSENKWNSLTFAIAFALMRARKLVRGLRQELTEEERYRVADSSIEATRRSMAAVRELAAARKGTLNVGIRL